MDSNDYHTLILKSANFSKRIPLTFPELTKSQRVSFQLVKNKLYEVQSNVPEPIFDSFINWWVDKTIPDITLENYNYYYLLNQEFQIDFIGAYLESKRDLFNDFEQNMLKLKDQLIQDKSMYEQFVITNFDLYLIKYPNDIMSLPIQQLCRLLNSPNSTLENHDLAYNLIIGKYNETHNPEYFILLSFLNGNKLSKNILEECFQKKEEHSNYLPKLNFASIEDFLNQKDVKIAELENELQAQQSKVNNLFRMFLDDQYSLQISHYYLPKDQNWTQVNINEFTFSDDANKYTLKTSSTLNDSADFAVTKLVDGKNELENGGVWSSKNCEECSLEVTFETAVCVDLVSLTSRNAPNNNQTPACFDVLARNGNDEFTLLKKCYVMMWGPNERKGFAINNSQSFTSYKLAFKSFAFRDPNGSSYSLAEFNLGKIQL